MYSSWNCRHYPLSRRFCWLLFSIVSEENLNTILNKEHQWGNAKSNVFCCQNPPCYSNHYIPFPASLLITFLLSLPHYQPHHLLELLSVNLKRHQPSYVQHPEGFCWYRHHRRANQLSFWFPLTSPADLRSWKEHGPAKTLEYLVIVECIALVSLLLLGWIIWKLTTVQAHWS